jgi:uncharacterized protein Yka (UPF0111/DUF47 family)
VTLEGLDLLAAWAAGDPTAATGVRDAEHRGDAAKRELLRQLRAAFVTPIEPEDLFALSRGVDRLLNHSRDLINEAEAMDCEPDATIGTMAVLLGNALRCIDTAISSLGSDCDAATEGADAAIVQVRRLESDYYAGMGGLLSIEDRNERIARRELYRSCWRLGEIAGDVAERVLYAVMKES